MFVYFANIHGDEVGRSGSLFLLFTEVMYKKIDEDWFDRFFEPAN